MSLKGTSRVARMTSDIVDGESRHYYSGEGDGNKDLRSRNATALREAKENAIPRARWEGEYESEEEYLEDLEHIRALEKEYARYKEEEDEVQYYVWQSEIRRKIPFALLNTQNSGRKKQTARVMKPAVLHSMKWENTH